VGLAAYTRIMQSNPAFIERVVEPHLAAVTRKVTERNSTL